VLVLDEKAPDVAASKFSDAQKRAESACRLDPQFPSPLMTKTLALVSAIARTNFMLLESLSSELLLTIRALTTGNIPEEEIPQKTRVSFAATDYHACGARLASSTPEAASHERRNSLQAELPLPKGLDGHGVKCIGRFNFCAKFYAKDPTVFGCGHAHSYVPFNGACGISDLVEDICRFREGARATG